MKFIVSFSIGFVLFNCFFFAGYVARAKGEIEAKAPPAREPEFIACMRTGCMYCAHMERVECGLNLSKCADAREYFCQHDVSIKTDP